MGDLAVFAVLEEALFYYSHRALHHPSLYHLHRQHHEFKAPVGLVAVYAHPIEVAVSNIMPLLLGPLLMGSHLLTAALWYHVAVFVTATHHSGYVFPWNVGLLSPRHHDDHHKFVRRNFGVTGTLDWLHGTAGPEGKASR